MRSWHFRVGVPGRAGCLAGLVSVMLSTTMAMAGTTGAADQDSSFRQILPSMDQDEQALASHLAPAEAAAAANAFFADPAPDDAALAALPRFTGTQNVPIEHCGPYTPQAVHDELIQGVPTLERRMKSEIYGLLNLRQVLATENCTCSGKVAPWEPVARILAAFVKANGKPQPVDAYGLRDEGMRLRRAVERLCGGAF